MPAELARRIAEGDIPGSLGGVLMPFPWHLERLRALRLQRRQIAVSDFDRMLDLPLWSHDGEWFAVSPRQVLDDPVTYADQWERTRRADPRWPVHVTPRGDRLFIIDGVHRLLRSIARGSDTIDALYLPSSEWPAIRA